MFHNAGEGSRRSEDTLDSMNSWTLPASLMFAGMSLALIVSAAVGASLFLIDSYTNAVDDIKETGMGSTGQCFDEAETSLVNAASHILAYSTSGVMVHLQEFVARPVRYMRGLESILVTHLDATRNSPKDLSWMTSRAVTSAMRQQQQVSLNSIGLYVNDMHYGIYISSSTGLVFMLLNNGTTPGTTGPTSIYGTPSCCDPSWPYPYNATTEISSKGEVPCCDMWPYPFSITNEEIPAIAAARIPNLYPPNSYRWPGIQVSAGFTGFTLTSNHDDLDPDIQHLNLEIQLPIESAAVFLKDFLQKTRSTDSETRLYCTIAKSWVAERLRELNRPDWEKYDQTNLLVAVSDGNATTINDTSEVHVTLFDKIPLKDVEATDDLIRKIAITINSTYAEISRNGTQRLVIDHKQGPEEFFVQIRRMDDDYGMDWWITTAIDRKFIMNNLQSTRDELLANLSTRYIHISDNVGSESNKIVVLVSVIVFLILLLTVYATSLVLKPIRDLQQDMVKVSTMNLEMVSVKQNTTRLREIREMQASFGLMVSNLKEYRAYVPNAVLEGNRPVDVEPPTGDSAIVFTDIQGSQLLWVRDDAAMNIALIQHNEIVRSTSQILGGYEVKTVGDSFMIAFTTALNAVFFSIKLNHSLSQKKWPTELGLDKKVGLLVRSGCQYGTVILEQNPLTGRADYRGTTVNMASRLEKKSQGGCLCVCGNLMQSIREHIADMDHVGYTNNRKRELKGLGNFQTYLIYPKGATVTLPPPKPLFDDHTSNSFRSDSSSDARNAVMQMSLTSFREGDSTTASLGSQTVVLSKLALPSSLAGQTTGLSLASSSVTVAICSLKVRHRKNLFDDVNLMVSVVGDSASETDGVLGSVMGNNALVSWNTSKTVRLHPTASMRFAARIEKRARLMTVGIATGKALHGNIGTQKRRFHAIFGPTLNCAQALSGYSDVVGCFCMMGDCTKDHKLSCGSGATAVDSFVRLVDAWHLSSSSQTLHVYEVLCDRLRDRLQLVGFSVTENENRPPAREPKHEEHHQLMKSLLNGDNSSKVLMSLSDFAKRYPEDNVLFNVVKMFQSSISSEPFPGYRCKVTFNQFPEVVALWSNTTDSLLEREP